jgi:hypothetical protein
VVGDAAVERGDPARGEDLVDEPPHPRVLRRIAVEHVLAQLLQELRRRIVEQHAASPRREHRGRAQDRDDIAISRDGPARLAGAVDLRRDRIGRA